MGTGRMEILLLHLTGYLIWMLAARVQAPLRGNPCPEHPYQIKGSQAEQGWSVPPEAATRSHILMMPLLFTVDLLTR